jgi:GTPase SAR1 family protein
MKSGSLNIGVVGVCGAGKTTLIEHLEANGYRARQIAQEHSYVPDMWQRLSAPDVLIYLEAEYPTTLKRKLFNWTAGEYQVQIHRLRHAKQHADLQVNTDSLSPQEVLTQVLSYLESE